MITFITKEELMKNTTPVIPVDQALTQCYETLRKRRFRALDRAERDNAMYWWKPKYQWTVPTVQRYLGFAFLTGLYDAEKYMWDHGFAMKPEDLERLEQSFVWDVSVAEPFGRNMINTGLSYLDGVRAVLAVNDWDLAADVELC